MTGDALEEIADPGLRAKLMEMYLKLGIFPEVLGVLYRLPLEGK